MPKFTMKEFQRGSPTSSVFLRFSNKTGMDYSRRFWLKTFRVSKSKQRNMKRYDRVYFGKQQKLRDIAKTIALEDMAYVYSHSHSPCSKSVDQGSKPLW